jgi:integrase
MRVMEIPQNSSKLTKFTAKGSNPVATRLSFTKKAIEQLPSPTKARHVYFHDTGVRGLAVRVSSAGGKAFVLYRKIAGKPERITIGPFPDMSIEQARGRASELNGKIAAGKNPAAEKREIRNEMTLQELFNQFGLSYGQGKKTWPEMKRIFNVYLKPLHLRKISTIRKLDVIALHKRIVHNHGPFIANRAVELLSSMFNRAADWGWEGSNPAKVSMPKEPKRDRFLLEEEVPAFLHAVDADPNETMRDFLYVSLLTGGRRGNVQAMSWPQLNFNLKLWTIPAEEAKGAETVTVPLLPPVLKILKRRKKTATSEWVFPGSGRTGHLVEPKTAWKRILKAAGLSDLRLHDLRRTLASWQAIGGASLLIIGKSLGHKNASSTQVYARLSNAAVKESMEKAATSLLLAGKVEGDKL